MGHDKESKILGNILPSHLTKIYKFAKIADNSSSPTGWRVLLSFGSDSCE